MTKEALPIVCPYRGKSFASDEAVSSKLKDNMGREVQLHEKEKQLSMREHELAEEQKNLDQFREDVARRGPFHCTWLEAKIVLNLLDTVGGTLAFFMSQMLDVFSPR